MPATLRERSPDVPPLPAPIATTAAPIATTAAAPSDPLRPSTSGRFPAPPLRWLRQLFSRTGARWPRRSRWSTTSTWATAAPGG